MVKRMVIRWLYFSGALGTSSFEGHKCVWIVTKVRVDRNKSESGS